MVKLIHSALDTLEVSARGKISLEVLEEIDKAKERARLSEGKEEIFLGKERFLVLPHGAGMYRYLLQGRNYDLKLTPSDKIPSLGARIKAISLYEIGAEKALEGVYEMVGRIGRFTEIKVKRLDLCSDFQGWEPKVSDLARFVCRAKKTGLYLESGRLNYIRFGQKNMLARLYNKSEEIKKSGKTWLISVWKETGLYEEKKAVWRLEIQFRRQMLACLNIETPEEALSSLGGIWQFGLSWLEFKKPSKAKQKTRWPLDRRWKALKEASFKGRPCLSVRKAKREADKERLIRGFGGYLTSLAAIYGDLSLKAAILRAGVYFRHYLEERGLDFTTVVKDKMKKREEEPLF